MLIPTIESAQLLIHSNSVQIARDEVPGGLDQIASRYQLLGNWSCCELSRKILEALSMKGFRGFHGETAESLTRTSSGGVQSDFTTRLLINQRKSPAPSINHVW